MSDRSLSRDMAAHAARTAGQPELRQQLAAVLRATPSALMDTPEDRARHASDPRNQHIGHHYYWGCAMCRGEVDTLADALLAVVQPRLDAKQAETNAWQQRHDRYATAHRQLLARCEQLRFAVRSAALLLRSTAERHQTGQPIAAATLRAAAKDLDDMAAEKDPT